MFGLRTGIRVLDPIRNVGLHEHIPLTGASGSVRILKDCDGRFGLRLCTESAFALGDPQNPVIGYHTRVLA